VDSVPEKFNVAAYLLDRHLDEGRGDKVAVYFEDGTLTYRELAAAANRLGNALTGLGVEPENRVIICLPDCPEFLAAYFGTIKTGAVPVPVSTMATAADYVYYVNDSRAKALIVSAALAPTIGALRRDMPYLKHFVVVGTPAEKGHLSWADLLAGSSPDLEPFPTSRDDMAFWLYSSGTTGTPKGVVHLHHDLMYFMPPHAREVVGMTTDDVVYSTSKLFFSYGRNNSLDSVFLTGAAAVLYPGLSQPEKILEVIGKYRPTLFYSVPSSYAAILNYLRENPGHRADLSSVRHCVSAGEALPSVIFQRWKDTFGLEILDGVGSTDVGAIYVSNRPGLIRAGSSGTVLPGFQVRLLDDAGSEVPPGEIGTLWVSNDGTTSGYWLKHDKTKDSFRGAWFNSGDQFVRDEDGYYWYAGRIDDMLKPGGRWLSPLEVENVLLEHAAVREAAVVGALDHRGLEKPVAYVILREGWSSNDALAAELQEWVRTRTAPFKAPRRVFFVNELPRTASGKVQRYKLRDGLRNGGPAV